MDYTAVCQTFDFSWVKAQQSLTQVSGSKSHWYSHTSICQANKLGKCPGMTDMKTFQGIRKGTFTQGNTGGGSVLKKEEEEMLLVHPLPLGGVL